MVKQRVFLFFISLLISLLILLFPYLSYSKNFFTGNYDCTEIALETYSIFNTYCNVEICLGIRTEMNTVTGKIIEETGHAWLKVGEDIYDPDVIVKRNQVKNSHFFYNVCFRGDQALRTVTREKELHDLGFDAFSGLWWKRNPITKKIIYDKPFVKYRYDKNSKWKIEFIEE